MITIVSWMVFFLVLATMFHFIYEGIVAPSLRMHLRYKLFALRDELREMLANSEVPVDVYQAFQTQLNTAISTMPNLHLSSLFQSYRAFRADPELSKEMEDERALMRACQNERFKEMQSRFSRISTAVLLTNSAGFLMWVVPAVYVAVCFGKIKRLTLKTLQLPQSRFEHFYGQPRNAGATC